MIANGNLVNENSFNDPYKQTLFFFQIFVLVSLIFISIANMIIKTGNLPPWTALLGSSMGYLLPSPRCKAMNGDNVSIDRWESSQRYVTNHADSIYSGRRKNNVSIEEKSI